jgi:hypothetical protein
MDETFFNSNGCGVARPRESCDTHSPISRPSLTVTINEHTHTVCILYATIKTRTSASLSVLSTTCWLRSTHALTPNVCVFLAAAFVELLSPRTSMCETYDMGVYWNSCFELFGF